MLSLRAELGADIRSAKGELIRQIPFEECHSFVKQFAQMMYGMLAQAYVTVKDTTGTSNGVSGANMLMKINTPANYSTWGMVIGNGTAAVTMPDYKLASLITAGVTYGVVSFGLDMPDASTWRVAITRGFTNYSIGDIDVKEAGLYIRDKVSHNVCIDRTLYTVSFGSGEILTLTYRITITL